MRTCCMTAWLSCAIDSEGTIQVWKQASKNMPTRAHGMRVMIYNADARYVDRVLECYERLGVRCSVSSRRTSKVGTKDVSEIVVGELDSVIRVLEAVIPHLTSKREMAVAVLGLAVSRKASRGASGNRTPWTDEQVRMAELIRKTFMPYRKRANGESSKESIPCQAVGSTKSTTEGVETRSVSSASDNPTHERPAPHEGEEIVRSSEQSECGWKPRKLVTGS